MADSKQPGANRYALYPKPAQTIFKKEFMLLISTNYRNVVLSRIDLNAIKVAAGRS